MYRMTLLGMFAAILCFTNPAIADELSQLTAKRNEILKGIKEAGKTDRMQNALDRVNKKIDALKKAQALKNKKEAQAKAQEQKAARLKAERLAQLKAKKAAAIKALALKKEKARLAKELEAKNKAKQRPEVKRSVATVDSNAIKWKGSIRYRAERIDKEGSDLRNRHRVQAKIGVSKKVNKYIKAQVGLATGSDDPVSTNQSLDNSFTTKSIMLDTATIQGKFMDQKLIFGKMKNPIHRPGGFELIWDGDLRLEGTHGAFQYAFNEKMLTTALNVGQFWVNENSSADDMYLTTVQFLLKLKFSKVSFNLGVGKFSYDNLVGQSTLYDSTDSFGNATSGAGKYATGYGILEYFAEIKFKIMDIPLALVYDMASNTKTDKHDSGHLYGIKIGKAKKKGSFQFKYNNREVESDAVLGVFTDSDFKGGGTDGKGHEFALTYMALDKTSLSLTHFKNDTSLVANNSKNYNRTQFDIKVKF